LFRIRVVHLVAAIALAAGTLSGVGHASASESVLSVGQDDALDIAAMRTRDMSVYPRADGGYKAYFRYGLNYLDERGLREPTRLVFEQAATGYDLHENAVRMEVRDRTLGLTANGVGINWRFAASPVPTTSHDALTVTDNGLTWTYQPTPDGVKATAKVTSRRGPMNYRFSYSLVGAAAGLQVQADGSLLGPNFVIPRPNIIAADGTDLAVGRWTIQPSLTGPSIGFFLDDSTLPDWALPYTLDPSTTFVNPSVPVSTIAAGLWENYVGMSSSGYWPTWPEILLNFGGGSYTAGNYSNAVVGKHKIMIDHPYLGLWDVPLRWQSGYSRVESAVRWNTATLPAGAVIESAYVHLDDTLVQGSKWKLNADWYDFGGVIKPTDWTNEVAPDAIDGWTLSQTAHAIIPMTSAAGVMINRAGFTGIRYGLSPGDPYPADGNQGIQWKAWSQGLEVNFTSDLLNTGDQINAALALGSQLGLPNPPISADLADEALEIGSGDEHSIVINADGINCLTLTGCYIAGPSPGSVPSDAYDGWKVYYNKNSRRYIMMRLGYYDSARDRGFGFRKLRDKNNRWARYGSRLEQTLYYGYRYGSAYPSSDAAYIWCDRQTNITYKVVVNELPGGTHTEMKGVITGYIYSQPD
jgi:hypothetical protein